MKIGITSNTYDRGGAELQRVLLANELSKLGHEVTLFFLKAKGDFSDRVEHGVTLEKISYRSLLPQKLDVLIVGTTNTEAFFGMHNRCNSNTEALVVAIHNPQGIGAPNVSPVVKFCLKIADASVALSDRHAELILDNWNHKVSHIVSNGVDTSWAGNVRLSRLHSEPQFDIGFLGRISKQHKGLDRLIQALASEPAKGLNLAIAGAGPDVEVLQDQIHALELDGRVTWLGSQDAEEFLTKIKVLTIPSRYEGQTMVSLEAQCANVRVVGSKESSLPERHGNIIVDADVPEVFGKALSSAVANFRNLPEAPLPASARIMAERYMQVINHALTGSGQTSYILRLVVAALYVTSGALAFFHGATSKLGRG